MQVGDSVGIISCSNSLKLDRQDEIAQLVKKLTALGLVVICKCIFEDDSGNLQAKKRAAALQSFYENKQIKVIFDVSGGDLANEVLNYLDFDKLIRDDVQFWGYSDLTTLINAIYTKTNQASMLYQIRNINYVTKREDDFKAMLLGKNCALLHFDYQFIQGNKLRGITIGGNIRCFLKLAGTSYWPNPIDKVLVLEACSGTKAKIATYFAQLYQLNVFEQIQGIILGTFLELNDDHLLIAMLHQYVGKTMPIVKTNQITHRKNSKAIVIGQEIILNKLD